MHCYINNAEKKKRKRNKESNGNYKSMTKKKQKKKQQHEVISLLKDRFPIKTGSTNETDNKYFGMI